MSNIEQNPNRFYNEEEDEEEEESKEMPNTNPQQIQNNNNNHQYNNYNDDNNNDNDMNKNIPHQNLKQNDNFFRNSLLKNIIMFTGLTITGNYLFFSSEKTCSLKTDEECIKHFIEPNLKYWVVYMIFSVLSFFILIYYFLINKCLYNLCYKGRIPCKKYMKDMTELKVSLPGYTDALQQNPEQEQDDDENQPDFEQKSLKIEQQKLKMSKLRLKKYQIFFGIIGLLNQFYIMIFSSNYIDPFTYHGAFKLSFNILTFLTWIFFLILYSCKTLYHFYGKKCFILSITLMIIAFTAFYYSKIENSCAHWTEGTYESADQSGQYCQIPVPKYCWSTVFDELFDVSKLTSPCSKKSYNPNYKFYAKFINNPNFQQKNFQQDYKYIAYPTNPNKTHNNNNNNNIQKEVLNNTLFYKTLEEAKEGKHETIVDIEKQEVIYNIERNKELVKERQQKKNDKSLADNIVVIYINSVSRRKAYRQLPRTLKYLSNNQNLFTEYFRFHSIHKQQNQNLQKLFYNNYNNEEEKSENILEYMKNMGYITAHSSNICQNQSYESQMDHEGFNLACDFNHQDPENPFGFYSIQSCFYKKAGYQHAFDYSLEFRQKYLGEKTFQFVEISIDNGYLYGQMNNMDEALREYIMEIDDGSTGIILVSDVGSRMTDWMIFQGQLDLNLERVLPMLFIKLPEINSISKEQQTNLEENQQKFVTMENLHYTLQEWIGIQNPLTENNNSNDNKPSSLFQYIDKNRDCEKAGINLEEMYCACQN